MSVDAPIKLWQLVSQWAGEIEIDPIKLGVAILLAGSDGEFEQLPEQNRLLVFDESTLLFSPVQKNAYSQQTRKAVLDRPRDDYGRARDPDGILAVYVRAGFFHIHPDAVLLFASRRSFAPPTFLIARVEVASPGATPGIRGRKPTKLAAVMAEMKRPEYLQRLGSMKEVEMETAFGASRDTCRKAKAKILSEIAESNSRH